MSKNITTVSNKIFLRDESHLLAIIELSVHNKVYSYGWGRRYGTAWQTYHGRIDLIKARKGFTPFTFFLFYTIMFRLFSKTLGRWSLLDHLVLGAQMIK